ncbi:hypothetical protein Tco_0992040 [Tanacetum coccineum]|uniref:Uncharacterized protein n=1 Tax=Tanacetum coccineum TaxID=301880 RepID=A0ABQ5F119_9ASTR
MENPACANNSNKPHGRSGRSLRELSFEVWYKDGVDEVPDSKLPAQDNRQDHSRNAHTGSDKYSILQAGNPVKEILLKLNLPDHRSILTDSKICIKMVWRYLIPTAAQDKSRFIAACSYWTDKLLKLETSRKVTIKAFKDQEKYEHVGLKVTSAQDGQCLQVDNKRLYLVDDLKKLKYHLQVKQAKSLKSKSTSISQKIMKSILRAQD